jgi:hypothetical protein
MDEARNLQAFTLSPFRELRQHVFNGRTQMKIEMFQFQLARLDLAAFEHIVDQ